VSSLSGVRRRKPRAPNPHLLTNIMIGAIFAIVIVVMIATIVR
jgi:hypothetical protein